MTAPASPGTLIRMAEIRPPNSQPEYTAASKTVADSAAHGVGNRQQNGHPVDRPSPGNMPMTVPRKAPNRQINRLVGVPAMAKLSIRWEMTSMIHPRSGLSQKPTAKATSSTRSNSRTTHRLTPPMTDFNHVPPKKRATGMVMSAVR